MLYKFDLLTAYFFSSVETPVPSVDELKKKLITFLQHILQLKYFI